MKMEIKLKNFMQIDRSYTALLGNKVDRVLALMVSLYNRYGNRFFYSIDNLCKDTGYSSTLMKKCISILKEHNFIEIDKYDMRNYYILNVAKVQQIIDDFGTGETVIGTGETVIGTGETVIGTGETVIGTGETDLRIDRPIDNLIEKK